MTHSHLPVQHLIKQVETFRARRESRDIRPDWLVDLIEDVADMFDPSSDARVGFDCQMDEGRWVVGLFLGGTEIVGGRNDGLSKHTAFRFDIAALLNHFSMIEACGWESGEDGDGYTLMSGSRLEVEGLVEANRVCLRIFAISPEDVGPGFRRMPDGTHAAV